MQIKTKVISLLCVGLFACSVQIKADLESMKEAFETINGMLDRDDAIDDIKKQAETLYDEMYTVLGAEGVKESGKETFVSSSSSSPCMTDVDGPYYEILMNIKVGLLIANRISFYRDFPANFTEYQQRQDGFYDAGSSDGSLSPNGIRITNHTNALKILAQLLVPLEGELEVRANISLLTAYFFQADSDFDDYYHEHLKEDVQTFVKNCGEKFGWKKEIDHICDCLGDPYFGPASSSSPRLGSGDTGDDDEKLKSDRRNPLYYLVPVIVVGGATYLGYRSDKCSIV